MSVSAEISKRPSVTSELQLEPASGSSSASTPFSASNASTGSFKQPAEAQNASKSASEDPKPHETLLQHTREAKQNIAAALKELDLSRAEFVRLSGHLEKKFDKFAR